MTMIITSLVPRRSKIGWSAYCSRMREVSLVTRILTATVHYVTSKTVCFSLPANKPYFIVMLSVRYIRGLLKSDMLSFCQQQLVSSRSGRPMNFKGKDYIIHVPNGRIISEELSVFIASPSSFRRRMINGRHLSHRLTNRG